MATIYSLICFGGLTGKIVTMTIASPCVVSLTNHGLRDGTGVVFSTSGALPTGITAGTTYYSRSTASGTFNLYDTSAHAIAGGATGRVNTSGSQSGTHTLKGAYRDGLTTDQKARYGSPGSERIYDGLAAWLTGRAAADPYDTEVAEIGEAFTDIVGTISITLPSAETKITPLAGAGFDGTYGAGYTLQGTTNYATCFSFGGVRTTVENISILNNATTSVSVYVAGCYNTFKNCLIYTTAAGYSSSGIKVHGAANSILNNIVHGFNSGSATGIYPVEYAGTGNLYANNLVVGCTSGFKCDAGGTQAAGWFYNNVAAGNTTNWSTAPTYRTAGYNGGISTDTPWFTGTDTGIKTLTADNSTFVNYAAKDFRPAGNSGAHTSSSPLVDAGVAVVGMAAVDRAGNLRPSYKNGSATNWDLGPHEFDWGYGPWPATATVTFTGINANSEIRVYDAGGAELAGVENCTADHVLTWAASTPVTIRIINVAYKIKEFNYTASAGNVSIPIQQDLDPWYSNP